MVISRQLLSDVSTQLTSMADNVAKTVAHFTLDKVSTAVAVDKGSTVVAVVHYLNILKRKCSSLMICKAIRMLKMITRRKSNNSLIDRLSVGS